LRVMAGGPGLDAIGFNPVSAEPAPLETTKEPGYGSAR